MAQILVIDDDSSLRTTIRRILTAAGHVVLEAGDGDAGLELLKQHEPVIVITDIYMPNKQGIETIREIRRLNPDIKIAAMSGGSVSGNEPILLWAQRTGADAILPKPFRSTELVDTVNRLLSGE